MRQRIRTYAKRVLRGPRSLALGLWNYGYDFARFSRATSFMRVDPDPAQREALLLKAFHSLEKGLALPAPRPGFGQDKAAAVMAMIRTSETRHGPSAVTRSARGALRAWLAFNAAAGIDAPAVARFLDEGDPDLESPAGAIAVERDALWRDARIDFARFAAARHSVRHFTGEAVDPEDMRAAIAAAAKTPSVCNRSTCTAYVAHSERARTKALSFQDGNRGFGHLAGAVVIVTSDMRGFVSYGERNQAWIDGGMFAMSLNYALHALGYGVCMLNWSATAGRDRRMRAALGIPGHCAVITMMAVGRIPERLLVAASPRRPSDAFMASLD